MSGIEWVRTALAVQAAGSVTAGAAARQLSQPAASQHLAQLERALGFAVFERSRRGVVPTDDGARFLREIATPVEQIEWLLSGLEGGRADSSGLPLVVSCAPEWFEHHLVPVLTELPPLRARFELDDQQAYEELRAGRLDVAVTASQPSSAVGISADVMAPRRYLLVAAPELAPPAPLGREELRAWIAETPWVGFSEQLPLTRRFWADVAGSVAPTTVRVVVPDTRAALAAVEAGVGASLLPDDLCAAAIRAGRVCEVHRLGAPFAPPPWVVATRAASVRVDEVVALVDRVMRPG